MQAMRSFGHKRRQDDGNGGKDLLSSPVTARTVEPCGSGFGQDAKRRLIVTCEAGDLLAIRPERTARVYRIEVRSLFRRLLWAEANRAILERARLAKERKAQARRERAERKLYRR